MPIIIEGGSRCAGWWWARHLQNTEKNERAALVEIDGLSAESVPELFREMHAMSLGTKCKNYFYQANINPRADEHLTPAQRHEAVEALGRNLGLSGQPYFVIEHEKEGRTHQHVIWLRVDLERMKAIPDSLTARIHEQTSRELETKFGLEPGKSILVADRDFERPERRAEKHERFRGAQNGLDPHAIGNELKALKERSDGGQSFRAGMDAAGYVLARGDRRDFVVVDQIGDDHSLARRLGMKAAELRGFMKDVDAARLSSVAEAKVRQHVRQAAHEARQKHGRAGQGIAPGQDNGASSEAQRGRQATPKPEHPLNPTQGAIRAAWTLSQTGEQLTEALAARGIGLAQVTAEEARGNQRAQAFAREVRRFVRPMREGEIVAVNERGDVYHFERRTTGAERGEIDKRLAGIAAAGLLSVTDTRDAMREARRAGEAEARRTAREQSRPVTPIEQAIIKANKVAAGDQQKFAAVLDQAGITIARVSAADIAALDALRRNQELERIVADAAGIARQPERQFGRLEQGELAAVTRQGDVFRLNPQHLETVAKRLAETGTPLPSITEARATFEIEREAAASFRQEMVDIQRQRRADKTEARVAAGDAKAADRGIRQTAATAGREARATVAAAGKAVDGATRTGRRFLGGLANLVEKALDFLAPPPPPTPEQSKREEHAAQEAAQERADQQWADERNERTEEILDDDRRRKRDDDDAIRFDRYTGQPIADAEQAQQQRRDDGLGRSRSR